MTAMRRVNLLLLMAVALTACAQPIATPVPTATSTPVIFPPTWTPTPRGQPTFGPTAPPKPTRTIGPAATPAASIVYTSTDSLFTLKIPSNWTTSSGQHQVLKTQPQQMSYVAFSAPGTAPQPAVLIFYKWPAAGPIDNDNAWQQAFAVASLAIKVCPATLTTGGGITIGGEQGKYIGYVDGCNVQGELTGFVHDGANYGLLIEAPVSLWETWRPILRDIISSFAFQ